MERKGDTDREPVARPKKVYTRPAIVHTEEIEARAMVCSKMPSTCNPGPAQS